MGAAPFLRNFAAAALAVLAGPAVAQHANPVNAVHPLHVELPWTRGAAPPTTSQCLAAYGIHCYQPDQLAKAYGLDMLHGTGIAGYGVTIVIVDSFGSPTIRHDLTAFDKAFGLPAPPKFKIIQPAGPVPTFDPNDGTMVNWAFETTLDVEWAHAFAPGANILLVETPVAETEGVQGLPEIVQAENYVIDHNLGDVISQSFGATEQTFPSAQALMTLRSAYNNARRANVTVLAAAGDTGGAGYEIDGATLYPTPAVEWPASDPLVTSVGGTMLTLDDVGNRLAPDAAWNDGYGAGGGGVSVVFPRPSYQTSVQSAVGAARGMPDISLSASVDGGVDVFFSFLGGPYWTLVGGTSEATPEFAGIVAMADQMAGRRLGNIGTALYSAHAGGVVDITVGDNIFDSSGYNATPGYDLASGLGTFDGPKLVHWLATAP